MNVTDYIDEADTLSLELCFYFDQFQFQFIDFIQSKYVAITEIVKQMQIMNGKYIQQ